MEEIDLRRLSKTAYTMKWYIVLIMILFISAGSAYSFVYNQPKYKSYTKIALTQIATEGEGDSTNSITQTDITMNKNLVDTYNEIITSKTVLKEVRENLSLDITDTELTKMISTTSADNTTILKIEVASRNPELSKNVANEIAKVFSKQVKEMYNISNVHILDEAEKSENPYNINHVRDIAIFSALGIAVSTALVLIMYLLDTTIKTEEDIENITKLPVLGTVPLLDKEDIKKKLKNNKMLDTVNMPTTEAFRTLRTNLTFARKNKKFKNILVTSSFSAEGKSYVSSNLAVALARSNKKVLIIDADMRKGRQNTIFKVPNAKGLSNFLAEVSNVTPSNVAKYIKTTSISDVHVMTSGDRPTNPSELISSKKMIKLIQLLDEIYDIVIIDGTPSLLVSDSIAVSKYVDNVIIVVAHKITKIDSLKKVKKLVENVGAKITGVVLNKYPIKESAYGEKYYYSDQKARMLEENRVNKEIKTVEQVFAEAEKGKEEKFRNNEFEILEEEFAEEEEENLEENNNLALQNQFENENLPDMSLMQYKMENISSEVSNIRNLFIQYMMNNKSITVEEYNDLKNELEYIKSAVDGTNTSELTKELREEVNNIRELTSDLMKQQKANSEKVKTFIKEYRKKLS
ncbi:MAG: polysaccharide biosynthesis tyrosine autokinase [Clostridia bacterium]|jgi:receptor protein-tyrosine kinase|nr:polysaccharide biosynthesis tyrosine autokinase [Clostridia bacterium]